MSVGSLGQVQRAKLASRSADNSVSKRELDLRIVELEGSWALAVSIGNCSGSDDLDGSVAGTMSASHIVV